MRIHVISIGGRIMHNLAIDLQNKGHYITGSDDEIYDPSRSNLARAGLLPEQEGWYENNITDDIDVVILGMHAKSDNPELRKALEIGLEVKSYPEFISDLAQQKKKVVVAGSHGKTTTTAMIMHVLKNQSFEFDYLVGAELEGFDSMIKISDAPLMILEGDEYLSSAIDSRAKMLHYNAHLAVITGIAWDHINVFPTYESYVQEFYKFIKMLSKDSKVFFYLHDDELLKLALDYDYDCERNSYDFFPHDKRGNLLYDNEKHLPSIFGLHNMANMEAAHKICLELGVKTEDFIKAIINFKGASKRLELLSDKDPVVYRDFAHAPSKVTASVEAIRSKYKHHKIAGFLELHTYSSLNKAFIPNYKNSLSKLDKTYVYFNPKTLEIKQMEALDEVYLKESFNDESLVVINDAGQIKEMFIKEKNNSDVILIMSSGNLGKLNLNEVFNQTLPRDS